MTDYRRAKFDGGYYFFTLVTHNRRPILTEPLARQCLHEAWQLAKQTAPFDDIALCLLPDHLHCIWQLPAGDSDFSLRWSRIKSGFTHRYLRAGGTETHQSTSRIRSRERGIWQRRFWEHQIRDERDLQRHIDYLHYNPVKHALVEDVADWPFSTYHRYLRDNLPVPSDWQKVKHQLQDFSRYE